MFMFAALHTLTFVPFIASHPRRSLPLALISCWQALQVAREQQQALRMTRIVALGRRFAAHAPVCAHETACLSVFVSVSVCPYVTISYCHR